MADTNILPSNVQNLPEAIRKLADVVRASRELINDTPRLEMTRRSLPA
jgi:hypothetical protein